MVTVPGLRGGCAAGLLARGSLRACRLPGPGGPVAAWQAARRLQSRGRLRDWTSGMDRSAPHSLLSPSRCAARWGTVQKVLCRP